MPQPPAYAQSTDFSGFQAQNPASPYRGDTHDIEFANLASTIAQILLNLRLIQRDDGLLANQIVTLDSLGASVKSFLAAGTASSAPWVPIGAWLTATSYRAKDVVTQGGSTYVATVDHASGTFATDLAAVKWLFLAAPPLAAPAFPSGTTAKSAGFTAGVADFGKLFTCTGTFTIAFDAAAVLTAAWSILVRNVGGGIITLDPSGAELVDGAATQAIFPGEACTILCTGAGIVTVGLSPMPFLEELLPSASTGIDFSVGLTSAFLRRFTIDLDAIVVSSAGATINQRVSNDNGASYKTGASDYAYWVGLAGANGVGTESTVADNANDAIILCSARTTFPSSGKIEFTLGGSTLWQWSDISYQENAGGVLTRAQGHASAIFAVTNVRLYPSLGTFTGSARLYGHRKK